MRVTTKAYGVIDVDERQTLVFPEGLFGFEAFSEYLLLDADRQPFYWLQSVDSAALAFVLIDPFLFRPDYELDIGDEDIAEIGISGPENALVFSIVTMPQDGGSMTANLQGPLIINRTTRVGKQLILADGRWKTRHNIMEELAEIKLPLGIENAAEKLAGAAPC